MKFNQTLTSWWIVTGVTQSRLKELKLFIVLEIVNKIHGNLFLPCCPCHKNENKNKAKFIKAQCGKFYQVKYEFQYDKNGTTIKILPAMCEKSDLEGHLFIFWKHVSNNKWSKYIYAKCKQ